MTGLEKQRSQRAILSILIIARIFISSFLNSVICWEVDDFSFVLAGFKLNNILMKTPYNMEKIMPLKNLELKL